MRGRRALLAVRGGGGRAGRRGGGRRRRAGHGRSRADDEQDGLREEDLGVALRAQRRLGVPQDAPRRRRRWWPRRA